MVSSSICSGLPVDARRIRGLTNFDSNSLKQLANLGGYAPDARARTKRRSTYEITLGNSINAFIINVKL